MNRTGYANPEVDRSSRRAARRASRRSGCAYYHRIQEILAEDLPMIFLYYRDSLPVVSSRIRGIKPAPAGILYNFNEWYVPKAQQRYTSG